MEPDIIKVDMSLVQRIHEDPNHHHNDFGHYPLTLRAESYHELAEGGRELESDSMWRRAVR